MNSNAHWNDPWLEFSAFKMHLHTLWTVGSASFAAWSVLRTKILLTHYSAFYPQPGIYLYLCQSLSLFLIFLFHTHTHTHTRLLHLPPTWEHMRTHTHHTQWVTLPPWGRTIFNCSSALSSVFRRLGIKREVERERNEEGGRQVTSWDDTKRE